MAEFRDTVLAWCVILPLLGTIYVWLVTYTVFTSPAKSSSESDPAPSPSALTSCSPESLRSSMSTSLGWMTLLYCFAGLLTYFTRKVVDTIATAEAKGDVMEEEVYKYAREQLKEAVKDVEVALTNSRSNSAARDEYVRAVGRRNLALAKVERARPKEGLARVARRKRTWVKTAFIANFVSSLGAGAAASCAYYFSLELQYGCMYGADTIVPFSVLGVAFLLVHCQSCLVAATQD